MSENIANITIQLDTNKKIYSVKETITGVVTVKVYETVHYEEFTLESGWHLRGQMNIADRVEKTIPLAYNGTWEPDETYEYRFEFQVNEPYSVLGKYIDLRWFARTQMTLDSETKSDLRSRHLKNFKLFKAYDPSKVFEVERAMKVGRGERPYKIQAANYTKETNLAFLLLAVIGLVLAGVFYMTKPDSPEIWIIISLVTTGIFLYTAWVNFFGIGRLGNVNFTVKPLDNDHFTVQMTCQKNWNAIKHLHTYLELHEEVVDNRGTSSTTYRNVIHTTPKKQVIFPSHQKSSFEMAYPKGQFPTNFSHGDAKLFWQLVLDFEFDMGNGKIKKEVVLQLE